MPCCCRSGPLLQLLLLTPRCSSLPRACAPLLVLHTLPAGCQGAGMCPEPRCPSPPLAGEQPLGHTGTPTCQLCGSLTPRVPEPRFLPSRVFGRCHKSPLSPGSDETVRLRRIKVRHFLQTSDNFHVSFPNPDRCFNNRLKCTILVPFPSLLSPLLNAATQPHSCCPIPTSPNPCLAHRGGPYTTTLHVHLGIPCPSVPPSL